MRRLSFGLIGLTLLCGLTACGRTDQKSGAALSAMHRKVIPLTAGEYLVKITKASSCNAGELSVTQHWEYPDPTEAINPVIELNVAGDNISALNESAPCTMGKSEGWTLVKVTSDAGITADWGNDIASVERIQTKSVRTGTTQVTLDEETSYVVDVEVAATCRNQLATVMGQYDYSDAPEKADKRTLQRIVPVTDNLFHRAICKTPSIYSASDFIASKNQKMLVTGTESLGSLQKLEARQITERVQVYPSTEATALLSDNEIEIAGEDGNRLMKALENLGVVDTDPMIGATNLSIKKLRCDRNASQPKRGTSCTYTAINGTTPNAEIHTGVTGDSANEIFTILEAYGASVPAGINPQYSAVGAKELTCSLPVVPNPVANCWVIR
jgi:hypothetical protein